MACDPDLGACVKAGILGKLCAVVNGLKVCSEEGSYCKGDICALCGSQGHKPCPTTPNCKPGLRVRYAPASSDEICDQQCGYDGEVCCAGATILDDKTCHGPDLICDFTRGCERCGHRKGGPACASPHPHEACPHSQLMPDAADPSTCVECGEAWGPCCPPGGAKRCGAATLACDHANKCVPCGFKAGDPCCAGYTCDAGLECQDNVETGEWQCAVEVPPEESVALYAGSGPCMFKLTVLDESLTLGDVAALCRVPVH